MKTYFTILFLALFTCSCFSQWNLSGNPILGNNNSHAIGYSMSVNGAGNRVAIVREGPSGGNHYDLTYVFELQDNHWVQLGTEVQAANMDTSSFVAINALGNRIVIGEDRYNEVNLVRIFEFQSNGWVQLGEDILSETDDDKFGKSLAINAEGNIIICGAPNNDYSKAYQLINNVWQQMGTTLIGSFSGDKFGESVIINNDGARIAISSPNNDENGNDSGKINIYEFQNDSWIDLGQTIYGTQNGDLLGIGNKPGTNGIDLNGAGDVIILGGWGHIGPQSNQVGQVKVYELVNNSWLQKGETIEGTNENYYFGGSVSINDIGDIIVVGDFYALGYGQVKVFKFETDSWEQYGNTVTGTENGLQSFFGFCVSINNEGNIIGIGSPDDSASEPSQVRIFEYDGVIESPEFIMSNIPKLYPNPNSGKFYINIPDNIKTSLIQILDNTGKLVYSTSSSTSETIEINQYFSSGIYFVNILTNTSIYNLKMIVE